MVALFNRFKSQSISTRYLGLCPRLQSLIGKSNDFDMFLIWNVQDPRLPIHTTDSVNQLLQGEIISGHTFESSDPKYWNLKYGQIVRLQHVQSGFISKPFVLCRVADRNWIEYNLCGTFWIYIHKIVGEISEPLSQVSQLQRVALMALTDDFEFMSLEQESITLRQSLRGKTYHNAGHFELEEGSIWTLSSIGT
jgi:hypothetical protein